MGKVGKVGKVCCCLYHDVCSSWQLKLQMVGLRLAGGSLQSAWWQEGSGGSDVGEGEGVGKPVGTDRQVRLGGGEESCLIPYDVKSYKT